MLWFPEIRSERRSDTPNKEDQSDAPGLEQKSKRRTRELETELTRNRAVCFRGCRDRLTGDRTRNNKVLHAVSTFVTNPVSMF